MKGGRGEGETAGSEPRGCVPAERWLSPKWGGEEEERGSPPACPAPWGGVQGAAPSPLCRLSRDGDGDGDAAATGGDAALPCPGPRGPSPTLGGGGGAEKINFPLFEGSGEGKGGPRGHLPLTHCHRHLRPHLEWREKSEATAIL